MYINNVLKDEIRNDFLVTADRKKLWEVELDLVVEFDKVCKKYNLKYWASAGTLLGAVRHSGFVPWDDDIDLMMFRTDYRKLCEIAKYEFNSPYFFQNHQTDNVSYVIGKLRNSNTAAIDSFEDTSYNQGIFIDIWVLDDNSDGSIRNNSIREIKELLQKIISSPKEILDRINDGEQLLLSRTAIDKLMKMDFKQKIVEYELFCENHFGESSLLSYAFLPEGTRVYQRDWFRETVLLDFETIKIPAPIEYEKCLEVDYGDWHKMIKGTQDHKLLLFSADISYKEILSKCGPVD